MSQTSTSGDQASCQPVVAPDHIQLLALTLTESSHWRQKWAWDVRDSHVQMLNLWYRAPVLECLASRVPLVLLLEVSDFGSEILR